MVANKEKGREVFLLAGEPTDRLDTSEVGEKYPGMSPTQALLHELRNQVAKRGKGFVDSMVSWVRRDMWEELHRPDGLLDKVAEMVPTEEELARRWFVSTAKRALVDEGYDVGHRYWKNSKKTGEYYKLVAETERNWRRFSSWGMYGAVVGTGFGGGIRKVKPNFDETEDLWARISRAYERARDSKWGRALVLSEVLATEVAVLAACGFNQPVATQVVETPIKTAVPTDDDLGLPTLSPYASPTWVPTATATERAAPTPTIPPERPIFGAGGPYTQEQMDLINNGEFAAQEGALTDWVVNYWGKATNRPFYPAAPGDWSNLHFTYKFDSKNPDKALVGLESSDYPGVLILRPLSLNGGKFTQVVTYEDMPVGGYIPEGMGPLMLTRSGVTEDGKNWALIYQDGEPVRIGEDGEVMFRVNTTTGEWERVVVDVYKGFDRIPATVAEIVSCPLSPDPINDTENFLKWREGYWTRITEDASARGVMESFAVESKSEGSTSVDWMVNLEGNAPLWCYRFSYDGKDVVVITAVWSDRFSSGNITDNILDPNDPYFTVEERLRTIRAGGRMLWSELLDFDLMYQRGGVQTDAAMIKKLREVLGAVGGAEIIPLRVRSK